MNWSNFPGQTGFCVHHTYSVQIIYQKITGNNDAIFYYRP